MEFAGVNYLAVGLAAVAAFAFGSIYYGVLAKPWMAALGKTEVDLKGPDGKISPTPFIISFIAELFMAWVLAGVIGHLGNAQVTLFNGIISALFVWAGFVATTQLVNHRYQDAPWSLTFIDAGHWLGVLVVMGAVIGWFGV